MPSFIKSNCLGECLIGPGISFHPFNSFLYTVSAGITIKNREVPLLCPRPILTTKHYRNIIRLGSLFHSRFKLWESINRLCIKAQLFYNLFVVPDYHSLISEGQGHHITINLRKTIRPVKNRFVPAVLFSVFSQIQ